MIGADIVNRLFGNVKPSLDVIIGRLVILLVLRHHM